MKSVKQLFSLVRRTPRALAIRPTTTANHPPSLPWPIVLSTQARHASSQTHQTGSESDHSGPSEEAKRRARNLQMATGAATAVIGGSYILYLQLKLRAAEHEDGNENPTDVEQDEEEDKNKEKKRLSFHDQRVIAYEDRLRAYSTPDKIFRLFATLNITTGDGESTIYMTPADFIRSITPGVIQPEGLGLDKFRNLTIKQWIEKRSKVKLDPNSIFSKLGNFGLISFSDYLFFLTLLATPARRFEIAFKMFDLDGNGEVDVKEFEMVQRVVLDSTAVGARHRDHSTTGNVAGTVADALVEHFFGPNRDQLLTIDKFQDFHSSLQLEVLKMEFERYSPQNGHISEYDFAQFILSQASLNDQRRKKFLSRIKKAYGKQLSNCPEEGSPGITFEEVKAFSLVAESIQDVETALSMHSAAGASITASDLKDVAYAVVGVKLSDHLVEVIITLFDEDNDGNLSHREFIKVMISRVSRGLNKSKELGFVRLMSSVLACSTKTVKDKLGIK